MLWDTHMHTAFSGDSEAAPDAMVEAAIQKHLSGICFTDHLDWDYPDSPELFSLDTEHYYPFMRNLSEKYAPQLPIHVGIELGLQPQLASRYTQLLHTYAFDFVIGSSHVVHGMDPYYPAYYKDRDEDEAYMEYFTSILENIQAFDDFDVYGHIDYVVRYGPNKNKYYTYEKFQSVIDEILSLLIEKGKGIEINTAGFKYNLNHPNPTEKIIARYRELGGEIITIGADGHAPDQIAYDFSKVPAILMSCGFEYYHVFKNRKPEIIQLPI